ncbi:hypothetical protein COLU111180_09650 [Cohnella lubricantis]|uniref:Spore germination protein n=1 Tax=Cohnella lubricantis TaxID=2163172 RepID=A0A841TDW8_9BACL|nr:hypothetical protein [Cohnella lubricantis]MBB6678426.1 hypothetical protein [Cohnella lubricantis]MBP2116806.1 hypothetical protein [Cohnella lubricantis]
MIFFTPTAINLLGLKINTVDNSSVVNAGALQYIDQFVSYKRNQGFGELNGDLSQVNVPLSLMNDPDLIDSTSNKASAV